MKVNPPTLRQRDRYILFKVHSTGHVNYQNLKDAVMSSLMDFLGERGTAEAGVSFIRNVWDQPAQTGVLRCSTKHTDLVKVGIAMVHQIGDEKVSIQTLRVSGTMKGLKKLKN